MAISRSISILGATGSIGLSTAAVIEELRAQGADLRIEAVTAGRNIEVLRDVCQRLRPKFAAVAEPALLEPARQALLGLEVEVGAGPAALRDAAARPADWVMSAIVGAAGLLPTMEAVRRGATVALANKECLVCAGALFTNAARAFGATLLPVDSEHNAIFQVLTHPNHVEKITLTASGGPFLNASKEAMAQATPSQACAHPKWSMGRKISVDSATLMNKGLELIEAAYLFELAEKSIDVLVHPESTVHSLVHYVDGSVLAQLASPDMRVPIAYTLAWPSRAKVSAARLDLAKLGALTFQEPDPHRFPALQICRQALLTGGNAVAALNAANEIAVEEFLCGRIGFLDVTRTVQETLTSGAGEAEMARSPASFDEVYAVDEAARAAARHIAGRLAAA